MHEDPLSCKHIVSLILSGRIQLAGAVTSTSSGELMIKGALRVSMRQKRPLTSCWTMLVSRRFSLQAFFWWWSHFWIRMNKLALNIQGMMLLLVLFGWSILHSWSQCRSVVLLLISCSISHLNKLTLWPYICVLCSGSLLACKLFRLWLPRKSRIAWLLYVKCTRKQF